MIAERIEQLLELSPVELDARLRELFERQRQTEADMATAVAVIDQRKDYLADGHRSTHAYVKATLNCDGGQASRVVRQARTVNEHPAVGDALAATHIGTAQADRLARAAQHRRAGHRFGEFSAQLIEHAEHLKYADFDTVATRFEMLADIDGAFGDDEFHFGERSASVVGVGAGVHVVGHGGSPLQAAEMFAVFRQAEQDEFRKDSAARRAAHGDDALGHPLARTAQQRKFDAMHSIFMAYVTKPADGIRPEPLVDIVIDPITAGEVLHDHGLTDTDDVFTTAPETDDLVHRRCETSTGVVVHTDIALQAMLTGHIRRVVIDSAGVVTDMGRKSRLFSGLQREAAKLLVTTCTFNGCSIPADFCEVDHMVEWSEDDGTTDQRNACSLCGVHNRYKHNCRLRARRSVDGRVRLITPDGKVIKPVGERDPVWADPDPPSRPDLFDSMRLVPWTEFVEGRPHAHQIADSGFSIYRITFDDLVTD